MLQIQWTLPKLRQEERLPWIPEEKELDTLISSCQSKQMAAYLQTLKETFADHASFDMRFCFRKPEREETLIEHAGEDQADSQAVCSHIEKRDS